jgi:hypothetical protein
MPALSNVIITAVHDLGYTWMVCRLTVSRRLYVFRHCGVHVPGPMLQQVAKNTGGIGTVRSMDRSI